MRLLHEASRDQSDPAVRAAAELTRARRQDRRRRRWAAWVAAFLAFTMLSAAGEAGHSPGWISAILGSVLVIGLAAAASPGDWTDAERDHRELEAVWRQARPDAAEPVPWPRFAAWATSGPRTVQLVQLRCAPADEATPTRISAERVDRVDGADIAGAAAAMEELRERLAEQERAAREAWEARLTAAEQEAHRATLDAIDAEADARTREAEAKMQSELAAERAAEAQTQAAATAAAIRRP